MRTTLRTLALILAAAFLFCGAAFAEPSPGARSEGGIAVGVTLEKIGEYPIPDKEEALPADWADHVEGMLKSLVRAGSPSIRLLRGGYYVVDGGSGVNRAGLFDEQGVQLIPFEAALIRDLSDNSGEDTGRYLSVYYATEQTTDRTKALIYLSDGAWIGGNNPKDGDTMYEGYIRFYDLELRRFVPELQDTGRRTVSSCGDLLALGKEIYDADGRLVAEGLYAGNGYLFRNAPPREVYDDSLTLRFTSELRVDGLRSTGGYLRQYEPDGGVRVIDIDGAPVVDILFRSVAEEKYGILYAQDFDGMYVLVSVDGRVLAESKKPIFCLAPGYYFTDDGGSYTLVGYDGPIIAGVPRPQGNLQVFDKESGADAHTLVLGTGEMSLPFSRGRDLGIGLMGAYSPENHLLGVVDLFTGDALLPFEYDDVYASGGLICADAGSVRHVFRPCYRYR